MCGHRKSKPQFASWLRGWWFLILRSPESRQSNLWKQGTAHGRGNSTPGSPGPPCTLYIQGQGWVLRTTRPAATGSACPGTGWGARHEKLADGNRCFPFSHQCIWSQCWQQLPVPATSSWGQTLFNPLGKETPSPVSCQHPVRAG